MARKKVSTLRLAPKSKRSRKEQLKKIRRCGKSGKTADSQLRVTKTVAKRSIAERPRTRAFASEPCPSTSKDSDPKKASQDLFISEKTRTEFKQESYESIVGGVGPLTGSAGVGRGDGETKRSVVDLSQVDQLMQKVCCPQCLNQTISLKTDEKNHKGLAIYASVYCSSCEENIDGRYLAEKSEGSRFFAVNRQAVFSALITGLGARSFNNFCECFDLPGLHHKSFQEHSKRLYSKLDDFQDYTFHEAVQFVRQVHAKHWGLNLREDDILDINVSFDGTWLTRGHSSHIGVGCVVDLLTGLCIDTHVMCTYCQTCETTGKKLSSDAERPEKYGDWVVQHMNSCDKNFQGTSGMMEVEEARVLWRRSMERYKLRYTVLLSDGDAKTFNELTKIKPYGEDVIIDKEECVNHVSKRLGSALRNLVSDCKKRGVTLGGRGNGQLTQNTIRKLTIYYNRAIRKNSDLGSMKKAIMASLYHGFSTDKKPQHQFCPTGTNSWCFFQEALANHKIPGPHKKLVHTPLNEAKLSPHLMPVYDRLTDNQLLSRCVAGKTQNSNECLHSLIWSRCAKDRFASRNRVRFAVLIAVREFNFGASALKNTVEFFGFSSGHHMQRLSSARMQARLRSSKNNKRDKETKRRDKVRAAKLRRFEELQDLEGGPAYAAGQF